MTATTDRPPALHVRDLTVRHGGVLAVDRVSLQVDAGRITGLIGPNGSGKTSLLDACCGLVASRGSISVAGARTGRSGPAARARSGVGRTFQRPALFDSMSVVDNVGLGWEGRRAGGHPLRHVLLRAGDDTERGERARSAIDRCGVADLADLPAGQLSTGQRRLVELARVLAGGFGVLLLDEPGAGLDDGEKVQLARVLQDIRSGGDVAVLLVEHDLRLVADVCDDLFVLASGALVFAGTPADALADDTVRRVYLGTAVA